MEQASAGAAMEQARAGASFEQASYSVWCLLCGTQVGELVRGRWRRHAGCSGRLPCKDGMPRCCHCGGSLYLERRDPGA